ncbi:hypothetical protein GGF46_000046 [Coemansia sp. RSA 552]|nr:hypothetical protein GGF46_000046 [Coemansia sp. RSA 552]
MALQTEFLGKNIFDKAKDMLEIFPEFDVAAGRPATSEEQQIARLLDELRSDMQASMFYLQPPPPPRDIERYSDRYFNQGGHGRHSLRDLKTDVDLFPEELQPVLAKKRSGRRGPKSQRQQPDDIMDLLKDARDSDSDDQADGVKKKAGSDEEGSEVGDAELVENEEDEEEGNDYLDTYFDNGEDDDMGDLDDDDGGGGGDYY